MEGQVQVPVVSAIAGEPSCSFSASSETPRQGLGRTFPSPPWPRPGSSRILVVSTSTAPLASRPIRVSAPGHTYYVSHDGQGTAIGAMGRWSNLLFYHPLLTVQGLPCPVDIHSALFHLDRVRRGPSRPPHHTPVTSEASAKQASARSATAPARPRHSTKSIIHKARHVSCRGDHTD